MCFNEDKELQLPNGLMQGTYKEKNNLFQFSRENAKESIWFILA